MGHFPQNQNGILGAFSVYLWNISIVLLNWSADFSPNVLDKISIFWSISFLLQHGWRN